jgi:hypothetical protein
VAKATANPLELILNGDVLIRTEQSKRKPRDVCRGFKVMRKHLEEKP